MQHLQIQKPNAMQVKPTTGRRQGTFLDEVIKVGLQIPDLQLVRGSTIISSQIRDYIEITFLGLRGKTMLTHGLDHSLT